jgi:hypothetical protein
MQVSKFLKGQTSSGGADFTSYWITHIQKKEKEKKKKKKGQWLRS